MAKDSSIKTAFFGVVLGIVILVPILLFIGPWTSQPVEVINPPDPPAEKPPFYIIYNENSSTLAKNCTTGNIDYRSVNATEVIQSAIDRLDGQGKVFIEQGTYLINWRLRVTCDLEGTGNSTIIKSASGSIIEAMMDVGYCNDNSTDIRIYNVTVSNIQVDGSGAEYPGAAYGGIRTVKVYNGTFSDLYIHDVPWNHGISLQGTHYSTFRNLYVENVGYGDQYASGVTMGNAFLGDTSSYNLIENVVVKGATMAGIDIEPGHNNTVRNVTISDLASWTGGGAYGVALMNCAGMPSCSDNTLENIVIYGPPNEGIYAPWISRLTLRNVTIIDARETGIYANNANNITVLDSYIEFRNQTGVFFLESQDITVRGCTIKCTNATATGRGIQMTSNNASFPSTGNTAVRNTIINMDYPILFNGACTSQGVVTDNVSIGCIKSILILGTSNHVADNRQG